MQLWIARYFHQRTSQAHINILSKKSFWLWQATKSVLSRISSLFCSERSILNIQNLDANLEYCLRPTYLGSLLSLMIKSFQMLWALSITLYFNRSITTIFYTVLKSLSAVWWVSLLCLFIWWWALNVGLPGQNSKTKLSYQ
jgi:hypothetical protein